MKNVVCVLERKDIETLEKALVIIQLLNTHTCAYVDLNVADGIISTVKELADEIEKVYKPKTIQEVTNHYCEIESDGDDDYDDDDEYDDDDYDEDEPYAYCDCCGCAICDEDDVIYTSCGGTCCRDCYDDYEDEAYDE